MRVAALLLPWLIVGSVFAQPAREVRLPNIERPLARDADQALDTVAKLRRAATGVEPDARVDLRLLRNWLLSVAANAEPMSDVQATALLRADDLSVLIGVADEGALANDDVLHRATFGLPDTPDLAALQATLAPVGDAIAR
ncbi:MAG: hypothetical protein AAGD32_01390 [Planctomycetota bacterium]